MDAVMLANLVQYVLQAHEFTAKKDIKKVRRWDEKTPYGVHPVWCAMSLLAETALDEELRSSGAQALLFHDLLEDTNSDLHPGTTDRVRNLVLGMTFTSSEEEMDEVWDRGDEIILLKVYDKTSNLLDGVWMSPDKRARYISYLLRLCEVTETKYGNLNIIRIARAICT